MHRSDALCESDALPHVGDVALALRTSIRKFNLQSYDGIGAVSRDFLAKHIELAHGASFHLRF